MYICYQFTIKYNPFLYILIKLILLYDWCFNNIGVRRGAIGTERVKRHRLLYSRYTMDYRSAASIIRTKQNRIGQKTGIFGHSVPFPKKIKLLFNPNESLLYLIRKTPIKSSYYPQFFKNPEMSGNRDFGHPEIRKLSGNAIPSCGNLCTSTRYSRVSKSRVNR